ncbi:MAG: Mur ligase family protein [bacterium]|nr:Mur ligase family protein [bacterium]
MNIHVIGIGGIGASALAQYYKAKGHNVSGSDVASSEITHLLKRKGIGVRIGKHKASNVPAKVDLVIYSPAVQKNNPELQVARKRAITIQSYPEALGDLTTLYHTIAVSGTHGKSTTTAMIARILIAAKLDPTVIIGTKLAEFGGSNCRVGKGKYLVIEADEHMASFLNYNPTAIVLTTIEEDHLDFYGSLANIKKTFRTYVAKLPPDGVLVANKNDRNTREIVPASPRFKIAWYTESKKVKLKVPGKHNLTNAAAALTLARHLGAPEKICLKALLGFTGSWRRFEVFKLPRFILVSDYGHHPTEIAATMQAVGERWPSKKVWLVFQPHQYDRTYRLFAGFLKTLRDIKTERILIAPIYDVAGRERKSVKSRVSSKRLAQETRAGHIQALTLSEIERELKKIPKGTVLVVMGAGDVYEKLTRKLTRQRG